MLLIKTNGRFVIFCCCYCCCYSVRLVASVSLFVCESRDESRWFSCYRAKISFQNNFTFVFISSINSKTNLLSLLEWYSAHEVSIKLSWSVVCMWRTAKRSHTINKSEIFYSPQRKMMVKRMTREREITQWERWSCFERNLFTNHDESTFDAFGFVLFFDFYLEVIFGTFFTFGVREIFQKYFKFSNVTFWNNFSFRKWIDTEFFFYLKLFLQRVWLKCEVRKLICLIKE